MPYWFFLQFGTARWSPSAFTKSSTKRENDNISITTKWILIRLWQNTQVSYIRPIWASCHDMAKGHILLPLSFVCVRVSIYMWLFVCSQNHVQCITLSCLVGFQNYLALILAWRLRSHWACELCVYAIVSYACVWPMTLSFMVRFQKKKWHK